MREGVRRIQSAVLTHDGGGAGRVERILLLAAAGFVLVGAVTLYVGKTAFRLPHLLAVVLAHAACYSAAHLALSRMAPKRDPLLLPTAALLTGWGLLLVGRLALSFLLRQTAWLIVSTVALLALVGLGRDLRWLRRFRYTWLFGGLGLLAATLVFGVNPSGYGPRLWLGGLGVYFQPSELLKLLMVAFVASYLAEKRELLVSARWQVGGWRLPSLAYLGPLLAMFGLTMVILAWQKDLGAATLFFATFLTMLYLATDQRQYVVMGLVFLLLVGVAGYYLSDRVALRIDTWLNPWPEAADRGFQIVQSLQAFGAGGLFGQGLGLGSPTFIPAVHTDFAFAALAEEFGLAGTLAIIGLYAILMMRGIRIALRRLHLFHRFLAAGLTTGLAIQAWVIMAGNARLAPITGVTLPFVSYGGSSLLTSFISLALLLHMSAQAPSPGGQAPGTVVARRHPDSGLPYQKVVLGLGLAMTALAATCGYWAVARAGSLRARADNPRRVRYEQSIVRGRVLDRSYAALAGVDTQQDGSVIRTYPVPEAAPVVGYASLRFGTGGIEAAYDDVLRGEAALTPWDAAWQELLHQPPHGLDVQLTLDAHLQQQAQRAFAGLAGAAVLLDASSGEILVLASSPVFAPGQLDEEWETLTEDPNAPLVNRATQGLYQPGAMLHTAVVAEALVRDLVELSAPFEGATEPVSVGGWELGCEQSNEQPATLGEAYAAACPLPSAELGERLGATGLAEAVDRWSLTSPISLEIPSLAPDWSPRSITSTSALRAEAIGQGQLTVTPLRVALMAAALANDGSMPEPHLVLGHQTPERGWTSVRESQPATVIVPASVARELLATWSQPDEDLWARDGIAVASEEQPPHAWFAGVTVAADGTRYAAAVLIEHSSQPATASEIGLRLLSTASAR